MPKTPARDDYYSQSFRFTPEQTAVIKAEAKRLGSTTAFVRELIDDHRTMFGLPNIQVEVLEADSSLASTLSDEEQRLFEQYGATVAGLVSNSVSE